MHIFTNAMKNLARNKVRCIISGILMPAVMTLLFCALYFAVGAGSYIDEQRDVHLSKLHFKFKEELQWLGDEGYYNGMERMSVADIGEINFNSDGSMDKYNEPVYVTKDYFAQFAANEYAKSMMLSYSEPVYGAFTDDPNDEMRYRNMLYGGEFDSLDLLRFRYDYVITAGEESGNGECLIHEFTARDYGYKIGDPIAYYDADGNKLNELRISGFFNIMGSDKYIMDEFHGIRAGYNPYFIEIYAARYMIVANFDTAYYAYGSDETTADFINRHEINKYNAWYTIDDPQNFDAFVRECGDYENIGTIGFHPDVVNYEKNVQVPEQVMRAARIFTAVAFGLSSLILVIATLSAANKRRREIEVIYPHGAARGGILLTFVCEILIFMSFVTIAAAVVGFLLTSAALPDDVYIRGIAASNASPLEFTLIFAVFSLGVTLISVAVSSVYAVLCEKKSAR